MDRCALAYQYHKEGWNCAQSVAGACADLAGRTPEEVLPLMGGFGGGFGGSHEEVCGAVSGGVLIPMFVVGLLYRDRKSESFRSRLSVSAGRVGVTCGLVTALAFELIPPLKAIFGGGVIPAIVITVAGTVIPNFFYHNQTWKSA